ncbi:MAG: MFS transporter, partial [Verrucomicrobia bacterium]|nr:MFS transporter [Verrucomicrobiota bacterium]
GAAVGVVMSAFSLAQIAGVPFGLLLANRMNWHTPFLALAGLSALIWLGAGARLPLLRTHLDAIGAAESSVQRMRGVLFNRNHLVALALMALITLAGYLVFTDLATFLVKNVGVSEHQLPWIYVCGGAFTIFTMSGFGRLADRFGKRRIYTVMIFFAAAATLAVAHLPPGLRLGLVLIFTTAFTVCMSGRFVPAMAYVTACIEARHRGGFLAVNSSVSNAIAGLAAWLGGMFLGEIPTSPGADTTRLVGYDTVSWASAALSVASLLLIYQLRQVEGSSATATGQAETADPLEAAPVPTELVG